MITATEEPAVDLLRQCIRITEQGKYHAFFEYYSHLTWPFKIAVNKADVDYQSRDYEIIIGGYDFDDDYDLLKEALNKLGAEGNE